MHSLLTISQGGAAWVAVSMIKETYAPAILKRKAAQLRKETGDDRWLSRYDERISITQTLKTNLSRPFVMTATEPIFGICTLPLFTASSTSALSPILSFSPTFVAGLPVYLILALRELALAQVGK